MGITPQELQLLETKPHRTKLWLSIYEPNTVLACQVNSGVISKGARSISYDNTTSGSHFLVESGMTMYIGSTAGDDDKGRIRVKSADASSIEVAENSHIAWEDNLYLTIVNFHEITAIYPRIIQDPSDPTDVIFYKDYDIAYTNQNAVLGSFVNMGSHYAGFVDPATKEKDVYYSASGTSYVGVTGTSLNYHWWFQGGNPTGSHVHTPGNITYDTPGYYTTRLIVSGSNNAVDSSYRHISIYDKPEQSTTKNWIPNPRMYDGDGDDIADNWGSGGTVSPTNTIVTHPLVERGFMQRAEYTTGPGEVGGYGFWHFTNGESFSEGDSATLSIDIFGTADRDLRLYLQAYDNTNAYIDGIFSTLSITSTLTRYTLTYDSLPANTNHLRVRFNPVDNLDGGGGYNFDVRFGAVQVEKKGHDDPYIDGEQSNGLWLGAANESESIRISNSPILNWELNTLEGSRERGGYRGQIVIREDIPEETIRDGSLVVIFAEDWYGNTKQSIGGGLGRKSVVFAGYIIDGTISYDWQEKMVEFEVGSPTEVMKNIEGFSVSVESKNAPSTWFELKDMNVEKALYHYLRWHSTVLKTTDFEFPDQDFRIQYFDSDRESLYNAVNNLMTSTLIGNIVSDRQGKIWAEIDTSALDTPSDYKEQSKLILNNDNWMGTPIIEERQTSIVSYLEMGGIAYDGPPTHNSDALLTEAPGRAPNYRGRVERHQGLALSSQSQLNTLAGNVFAHKNARYPLITYNLAGNYRNWDIAQQSLIPVTIELDDTPRRISFSSKLFTMEEMEFEYNPEDEILLSSIGLTEITSGDDAETVTIPDVPEVEGGYNVEPLEVPPIGGGINLRNYASAKGSGLGDFPFDDPNSPGFDINVGDWGDVELAMIAGQDWEHQITINGDGYFVIPFTGKYIIDVIMENHYDEDIKIGISTENLTDWTTVLPGEVETIADENNSVISASGLYHFDAGDIVTVLLYNGGATNIIHGAVYAAISIVDFYTG